tara:strand:- start:249 stop:653 length:405 start_codon:yes stop_codon:yes gene_type:complete
MKNTKSNTGKSNPVTIANREDRLVKALSEIMVASGYSAICPTYNPENNAFDFASDRMAQGMFTRILGSLVKFGKANQALIDEANTSGTSRYKARPKKLTNLQAKAIEQEPKLDESGFFDITGHLEEVIDSYYQK